MWTPEFVSVFKGLIVAIELMCFSCPVHKTRKRIYIVQEQKLMASPSKSYLHINKKWFNNICRAVLKEQTESQPYEMNCLFVMQLFFFFLFIRMTSLEHQADVQNTLQFTGVEQFFLPSHKIHCMLSKIQTCHFKHCWLYARPQLFITVSCY